MGTAMSNMKANTLHLLGLQVHEKKVVCLKLSKCTMLKYCIFYTKQKSVSSPKEITLKGRLNMAEASMMLVTRGNLQDTLLCKINYIVKQKEAS